LRRAADTCPERTFLHFDNQHLTFGELDARGTAFANALIGLGTAYGDRVMLAMSNRSEWFMVQHGVSQAGGASVVVNPSWKPYELRRAVEITQPVAVVADGACAEVIDELGTEMPRIRICVDDPRTNDWASFWDLVAAGSGTRLPDLRADLATTEALLLFSSGTTGLPKAVRHSHRTLSAAITQRVAAYGVTDADRLQYFMAMCTTYGVICALSAIAARASLRLFRRFDAVPVLENIADEGITLGFGAAPVAIAFREVQDLERFDLSTLRWMMWGATPVLPEVAEEVTRRSGITWMQAYGTTEVGIASNPATEPERMRLDSPGYPLSDVVIRTVDPETGDTLPAGASGELVVQSPGLMMGYLPEADNEEAFLPDGSFRTGDIAYVDDQGWVHLTDRAKELIKVSAFQVAPAELERLISTIPGVRDCAVFGIPDARRGERPKAAIVMDAATPADAEPILRFVADRVASYKHLVGVVFIDVIPRNAAGKILRWQLRDNDARSVADVGAGGGKQRGRH
jgi:acyl-CoA synthetase (AMP-forming)/AMP-acid ligase II